MSFMVTSDCISCGACEPVCPNHGIRNDQKRSIYVIDSDACIECVGFFSTPQCAVVCPMNCCLPDPNNVHTEEILFERAKAIHANSPKQLTLTVNTSHFRAKAAAAGKWWKRLFRPVGNTALANAEKVTQS